MKNISPAQIAWLKANPSPLRVELLGIGLPNGQNIYCVIGGAADLTYSGQTYRATANGAWARGTVTSEAMRGALKSNSMTLSVTAPETVMYSGTLVPMSQSFIAGVWDAATVTVTAVYMPAGQWGTVEVAMVVFAGMVSDSTQTGRSKGALTCQDWLYLANLNVPKRVIQPGCFNTFGDAACTFSLASIGIANTVGAGFTPVTIPAGTAWPSADARGNSISASYSGAGYFANGKITWTSGNNAGFTSHVASFSGGVLTLSYPPPFPIAQGDGFTAYAGCQKTITDCTQRWGNQNFFAGFPFTPPPEKSV